MLPRAVRARTFAPAATSKRVLSKFVAARISAVAHYATRDMARLPEIEAERIQVILRTTSPDPAPAAAAELRHRLVLPASFCQFLGALQPRKIMVMLVRALALLHAGGHTGRTW